MSDEMNQSTEAADNHIPSFLDHIPEDIRNEPSLQSFKDIGSLAKSYINANKMIGNSIRIPSQDASEEARAEFYKKLSSVDGVVKLPSNKEEADLFYSKLGRPSKPEEYKIDLGGLPVNEEAANQFKGLAHSIGLTQSQADAILKMEADRTVATNEHYKKLASSAESVLKEKWGAEYPNQMKAVQGLFEHLGKAHPEAIKDIVNGPAGSNPVVLSMAAELAKVYREAGAIKTDSSVKFGLTSEEARARITEVRDNSKDALHHPAHPDHDARVEYMRTLYQLAYPTER